MADSVKVILQSLLNEIEDLRAHQVVTTVVLSALPDLSTTNLSELKTAALDKNSESYDALRRTIAEL